MLGFVTEYPSPVPWNLTAQAAKALVRAVPARVNTCVVTSGGVEKTVRLIEYVAPAFVQLHGRETPGDTARVAAAAPGVKVIKAIYPDTLAAAGEYAAAGVWALLFDPRSPENAALGGEADFAGYAALRRAVNVPVILAGGITPENIAAAARTGAPILDVMSGVESSPGIKDKMKTARLFAALKAGAPG
jgi:phosphoribosylanthranilate isomerase